MATIVFYGQFTASKVGKTGLSPTIDIDRITRADGTRTAIVTGGATSEGVRGTYRYALTGADLQTYDYVGVFVTTDITVDFQEVPALWTRWSEAVATDTGGRVKLAADGVAQVQVEAGLDLRQAVSCILATTAGTLADGDSTTTNTFKDPAGAATRVTVALSGNNRTGVTLNPS